MGVQKDKLKLIKSRNYPVIKSNEIAREIRLDLNLAQQKAIAFIASRIKKRNADEIKNNQVPIELEYAFTATEYLETCGMTMGGQNYKNLEDTLKSLRIITMWKQLDAKEKVTVSWLERVWSNEPDGKIRVKIDPYMASYYIDLTENFTEYELLDILPMKSIYSVRLYDLLKSYAYKKKVDIDIETFRKQMICSDQFPSFKEFKRNVIEPALKEINEYTAINVSYEKICKGKSVVGLNFTITELTGSDKITRNAKANKALDKTTA